MVRRSASRSGLPLGLTDFGSSDGLPARAGRPSGDYVRGEAEQATYLRELLEIFEWEGVDSAFWFTFAGYGLPHRPDDSAHDLDLASYGVVKMLDNGHGAAYPDMAWEPKESFRALAAAYAD